MSLATPKQEAKQQFVSPRLPNTKKISIIDRIAPNMDKFLAEECDRWLLLMGPLGAQFKQLGELDLGQYLENSLREAEQRALQAVESSSRDDLWYSSSQEISKLAKLRKNKRQKKTKKSPNKQHTTQQCEALNVDKYLDSYVEMKIEDEQNSQAGLYMWNFD